MYDIEETGVANAAVSLTHTCVRGVALNSLAVSYWYKDNLNLAAPNHHNDLHFTLGVILGNVAHFHATWHGRGSVSYYTCTAHPDTGIFTTTYLPLHANNLGGNVAEGFAQVISRVVYRAVKRDETARKLAIEKTKDRKGGGNRLFGSALLGITKPSVGLKKPHVDLKSKPKSKE